ncbi:MAG: DMT family transporter [Ramlibacter sp.]|nr:DMT family transporter [Ramlibacter sp.]
MGAVKTRHFAQLFALSALWGASFLFIRIASPVLGPLVMAEIRVALASLVLWIAMRAAGESIQRRWWRELFIVGALSVALPFALFSWAGLHLPAGYMALLNVSAVLFGTLFAAWLREDTLTARKLLGCVCGFAGVGMVVQLGPVQLSLPVVLAALACVTAAACYGLCTPLMKRATTRIPTLTIAAGSHMTSALLLLAPAAATLPQARFSWGAAMAVLVMGVVTSGGAFWMHLRIIKQVSPVAAMAPTFLIPLFGLAWGWIFLGEPMGSGLWLGGALVLLAAALVTGFNPVARLWQALSGSDAARP